MRNTTRSTMLLVWLAFSAGCGRFVYTPHQQSISLSPEQQTALAQQTQSYQQQTAALDRNNQELQAMLAQSRQQVELLQDQVAATQDQLREAATRLADASKENSQLRTQTQAMAASVQRQAGAEIRANNSLLRNLAIANLQGVEVRQDGDVIRVELAAEQLFFAGTPQLRPGAENLLRTVALDLLRNYPQQRIGIEGHASSEPVRSPQYPTQHHFSMARAMAVYDAVLRTASPRPNQLKVVAHGANRPLVSNATDAGRLRNSRIEMVVYPETVGP